MKNINPPLLFVFALMILISSCSVNRFSFKKNHQPRVQVEGVNKPGLVETAMNENVTVPVVQTPIDLHARQMDHPKIIKTFQTKESIGEKMVRVFFPKKKEILAPIFHRPKDPLRKGMETKMDGSQITGLVINLLALVLAISAIFMIFGIGTGNVWVYFAVGMILAVSAMVIGFFGKMLPWRGFGIGAIAVSILAVVLLLAFMVIVLIIGPIF